MEGNKSKGRQSHKKHDYYVRQKARTSANKLRRKLRVARRKKQFPQNPANMADTARARRRAEKHTAAA